MDQVQLSAVSHQPAALPDKRYPNTNNRSKGFSLIELTLVVVIVGFIILLISNLPNSISLIGQSRYASTAKDIAAQIIEDTRSQGYDNLADVNNEEISDYRLSSLPAGHAYLTVGDCPVSICKNNELIKEVTATLSWQESGKPKSLEVTTLVAKGGLK